VDIGNFAPIPLMFQTGYLTISEIEWKKSGPNYVLKTPNGEVLSSLLPLFTYSSVNSSIVDELKKLALDIRSALSQTEARALEEAFHNLLSLIPFVMHSSYEGYYQTVFFLALNSINQSVILEKSTGDGVIDAIVKLPGGDIFIIEFKYLEVKDEEDESKKRANKSQNKNQVEKKRAKKEISADELKTKLIGLAKEALAQISSKNYADMYLVTTRTYKVFKTAIAIAGRTNVKVLFEEIK
jgi:hypothetical protein